MSQFHSLFSCHIYSVILLLTSAWSISPSIALSELNIEQTVSPSVTPMSELNFEQTVSPSVTPMSELNFEQTVSPSVTPISELNFEQTLTISADKETIQDSHLNKTVLKSILTKEQFTSSGVALDNVIPHLPQSFIPKEPFPDYFNSTLYGSLQSNAIENLVKTNEQEASALGVVTPDITEDTSTQTFRINQASIPLKSVNTTKNSTAARSGIVNVTLQPYEQDFDLLQSIWFPTTPQSEENIDDITENTLDPFQYDHLANTVQIEKTHAANVDQMDYSWNSTKLTITLQSHDDSVTTFWTYESNDTRVTGFLVTYRINKREHYDSSKLGKNVRSFTLHSLHEDEDYVICVHAMVNTTAVKEACAHWNESSMKIVVGIMAGILFLIPCIVVIIWILVKDRRVRQKIGCGKEKGDLIQEQKLMKFQKCQDDHPHCDQATNGHPMISVQNELHKTNVIEDHTDSEDELWKRQSKVAQSLVTKDQKLSNKTLQNSVQTSQREK